MTKPQRKDRASDGDDHVIRIRAIEIKRTHPQGFGGHEFEYVSFDDLFKCSKCDAYEVVVRDGVTGVISLCPIQLLFDLPE
jgi:hypothetical protein